jgi:hypothetical protein
MSGRRQLLGRLLGWASILFASSTRETLAQSAIKDLLDQAELQDRIRRAKAEDEKRVSELYSTKPKRIVLGHREYLIPANFFGPMERDEPDQFVARDGGFGFFLFLPDFGGYTRDNWRDYFDPRLIRIVQVKEVDKHAVLRPPDGTTRPAPPSAWGDPKALFENRRRGYEPEPSLEMHGLRGYRRRPPNDGVLWTGTRTNGEFFFIDASLAPGEPTKPGLTNPGCEVRYYSETEDLFILYRYPQRHIESWRGIDDAIWAKLRGWRVK